MKELRRQYRFVTMIMAHALQSSSSNLITLSASNRCCSLPIFMVRELVSQGVLTKTGQTYAATKEAKAWLKRRRLELLKLDGCTSSLINTKPALSANETIVRLSRKSKGEEQAFLAAHHVTVANRVAALIEKSQLRQSVTQNLSVLRRPGKSLGGGAVDLSDMAIDCRKHLDQLVQQLPRDCAGVVVDVCGFDKGLQQVEFERKWPRRSAKLILRMGLDHAAEYWKIGAVAKGPDGPTM